MVTVGTIFDGSHILISKWHTAWFMSHRIRFAMGDSPDTKLGGVVEVDETFVGGKGDRKTKLSRLTPVVALI